MYDDILIEKFLRNVVRKPDGECWEWGGFISKKGYGYFHIGRGKYKFAHRMAWEVANGELMPSERYACHTCDNPPCVNPSHIYSGTPADNVRDRDSRNRAAGPAADNAAKTHCKRGHELNADNLDPYKLSKGQRCCLICKADQNRRDLKALYDRRRPPPSDEYIKAIQGGWQTTEAIAESLGVPPARVRKWFAKGDLGNPARVKSYDGRGHPMLWSPEGAAAITARAFEKRDVTYRRSHVRA